VLGAGGAGEVQTTKLWPRPCAQRSERVSDAPRTTRSVSSRVCGLKLEVWN
jgi:hypothetical protein